MMRVSIALMASGLPIIHGGSSGRTSGGCVGGATVDCDPVGASTNSSVDSRDTAFSVGGDCADDGACDAPASCEGASSPVTFSLVATRGTSVAATLTVVGDCVIDADSAMTSGT